ncbi:MAG: hypothetical protein KAT74_05025 [Candidatus Cloacimonetes bacterium]|jgi:hypothetical protein|nr:hypothetical protein [Candidatus Cloacimonadota bacterium]
MRKLIFFLVLFIVSAALLGVYEVGEVVADYSWTDNLGDYHSIYELTALGTTVVMFWGGTG